MDEARDPMTPFVWVAYAGVATTAVNTAIGPLIALGLDGGSAAAFLRAVRDRVLIVHALATLIPMFGLAIAGFRSSPFAAATAIAVTTIEKLIELVAQTLLVFPPEETLNGVAVSRVVAAIFDQLYFTLWLSNTIACAGWLMYRILREEKRGRLACAAAWLAGVLTLLMLLGDDYLRLPVPAVPGVLFFLVFTAYRFAIAHVLARATFRGSVL